jgi:hypothetical protein
LLNTFCGLRATQFEKKENDEEQIKFCEEQLRLFIGPFITDLVLCNTPEELEIVR